MANILYVSADNTITVSGLTGGGSYLNSATVTYAITDAAGTAVAGGTGTLSYVAASNGNYTGTVESTVAALLTPNSDYYVTLSISQGGYNDSRRLKCHAAYRGNT